MDEYTSESRIWELTCPGLLEEVGRVRRWTRDVLSDSPHVEDVALIVSELGTNALLHSSSGDERGAFRVTLARSLQTIAISVTDTGGKGTTPRIGFPDASHVHGRGVGMVHAIAHRVRVLGDGRHGYTVTAELHLALSDQEAQTEAGESLLLPLSPEPGDTRADA